MNDLPGALDAASEILVRGAIKEFFEALGALLPPDAPQAANAMRLGIVRLLVEDYLAAGGDAAALDLMLNVRTEPSGASFNDRAEDFVSGAVEGLVDGFCRTYPHRDRSEVTFAAVTSGLRGLLKLARRVTPGGWGGVRKVAGDVLDRLKREEPS